METQQMDTSDIYQDFPLKGEKDQSSQQQIHQRQSELFKQNIENSFLQAGKIDNEDVPDKEEDQIEEFKDTSFVRRQDLFQKNQSKHTLMSFGNKKNINSLKSSSMKQKSLQYSNTIYKQKLKALKGLFAGGKDEQDDLSYFYFKCIPKFKKILYNFRGIGKLNQVNNLINDLSYFEFDENIQKNIIAKEKLKEFYLKFPIIQPTSLFSIGWDIIHAILIIVLVYFESIKLVFDINDQTDVLINTQHFKIFAVNFLIFDMGVQVFTGIIVQGENVMEHLKIAKHYIHEAFVYDFLGLISVISSINSNQIQHQILKYCIFFKLQKYMKIAQKIEKTLIEKESVKTYMELFKLFSFILSMAHIGSLIFFGLGKYEQNSDPHQINWLTYYDLLEQSWESQYISSLQWAGSSMTTVVVYFPQTDAEKIVFTFLMIIVSCIFGYSVNILGQLINNLVSKQLTFAREQEVINRYMSINNVTLQLRVRIRQYLEYLFQEEQDRNIKEEQKVVQKLSSELKELLQIQVYGTFLNKIECLRNFSENIQKKIVYIAVEERYSPGEMIIKENDENFDMFFIIKGKAEVIMKEKKLPIYFTQGQIVGEIPFFTGQLPTNSIVSVDYCTLLRLQKSKFEELLKTEDLDFEIYRKIQDDQILSQAQTKGFKCLFCQETSHKQEMCPDFNFQKNRERNLNIYLNDKNFEIIESQPNPNSRCIIKSSSQNAYIMQKKIHQIVRCQHKYWQILQDEFQAEENIQNSLKDQEDECCFSDEENQELVLESNHFIEEVVDNINEESEQQISVSIKSEEDERERNQTIVSNAVNNNHQEAINTHKVAFSKQQTVAVTGGIKISAIQNKARENNGIENEFFHPDFDCMKLFKNFYSWNNYDRILRQFKRIQKRKYGNMYKYNLARGQSRPDDRLNKEKSKASDPSITNANNTSKSPNRQIKTAQSRGSILKPMNFSIRKQQSHNVSRNIRPSILLQDRAGLIQKLDEPGSIDSNNSVSKKKQPHSSIRLPQPQPNNQGIIARPKSTFNIMLKKDGSK